MTSIVPVRLIKLISGTVFLIFGLLILKGDKDEAEEEPHLSAKNTFISGFTMIFLSEWGDKTQIASAIFATEYNPWMVFSGVMAALTILSIMAIYLGKFISRRIDRRIVIRIAGALFILIGMTFMLSALNSSAFADII